MDKFLQNHAGSSRTEHGICIKLWWFGSLNCTAWQLECNPAFSFFCESFPTIPNTNVVTFHLFIRFKAVTLFIQATIYLHLSGVIILPTQTKHYWGEIPKNYQQHLHQVWSPKNGYNLIFITSWVIPLPSNSHHQDYSIFSRESL